MGENRNNNQGCSDPVRIIVAMIAAAGTITAAFITVIIPILAKQLATPTPIIVTVSIISTATPINVNPFVTAKPPIVVSQPTNILIPSSSCELASATSNHVGNLTLLVQKVTISPQGEGKLLELDVAVDNQTPDSLNLPLFGYFTAIGDNGRSYKADHTGGNWPDSFPARLKSSGVISIPDVAANVSNISISFTTIFGTLTSVRNGITVQNIHVAC